MSSSSTLKIIFFKTKFNSLNTRPNYLGAKSKKKKLTFENNQSQKFKRKI